MKIKNGLIIIAGLFGVASGANATEVSYGLGASLDKDSIEIYFPVETGKWLIEPSLSHRKDQRDSVFYRQQDLTVTTIELGVFKQKELAENISAYYGARVGKGESDYDYRSDGGGNRTQIDTKSISPTFGVKYQFAEGLTLALDLALVFSESKIEGSNDDVTGENYQGDGRDRTTDSDIIVRYVF